MSDIRCVAPVGDQCGEAATWVADESALYWTDINRFLVHRWQEQTNAVETWLFDQPCAALFATSTPGTLILALGEKLLRWRPDTDKREDYGYPLASWPEARYNDGRPGPGGELWLGSMGNNVAEDGTPGDVDGDRGELFRIDPDGHLETVRRGIGISNTVCFSPDRRHFYFGDTPRNVIWRYDYDPDTRRISNETPFFEGFERGRPDGSTVDAEGCLWNCRFGGGCVVRVTPDGSVDRIVEMPCTNITTCEFGGEELNTLFITTAAMMTDGYERLAGSLFGLDPGVRGLPPLTASLVR